MKILFVGDVVGATGRNMICEYVSKLKEEKQIDFVVANGENAAHGKGITKKIYHQLISAGVDLITMGNHTFSKDTLFSFIEEIDCLIRPMNLEPYDVGQHYKVVTINGVDVCFVNLMCEVFMHPPILESPFACMEEILETVEADVYFVDLHGEATSEKLAFSYYFEKEVKVVVGTHTHVQTADEKIENGCAFISDVGMCGTYRSVIGRDIEEVLTRFTTNEKTRFTVAQGEGIFCAVLIEIDETSKQATKIERIQYRPKIEA